VKIIFQGNDLSFVKGNEEGDAGKTPGQTSKRRKELLSVITTL
jgi:hypothetical protein